MANKFFGAISHIGGADGDLDLISKDIMSDGDGAFVLDATNNTIDFYTLDSSNSTAEDAVNFTVIVPDDEAASPGKRWIKLTTNPITNTIYTKAGETGMTLTADGAVELYYDGVKKLQTESDGIIVTDDGDDGLQLGVPTNNNPYILVVGDSNTFTLYGYDSLSNLTEMLVADPDGAVKLYYDGSKVCETVSTGLHFGLNLTGQLVQSGTGVYLYSAGHGAPVFIQGENAAGSVKTLFKGDPDSGVDLYNDGLEVVGTRTGGLYIFNGASYSSVYMSTATTLDIRNYVDTGYLRLRGNNSSSVVKNLLVGDPDGSVDLYYDGVKTFETTSEGISTIGGIKFPATQAASADANTLDDYEEGTWTATFADAKTGGNEGSVTGTGNYTKIGNVVTAVMGVENIDTTGLTAGNVLYITGLPYNATSSYYPLGQVSFGNVDFTAGTYCVVVVDLSSDALHFSEIAPSSNQSQLLVSDFNDGLSDVYISVSYMTA